MGRKIIFLDLTDESCNNFISDYGGKMSSCAFWAVGACVDSSRMLMRGIVRKRDFLRPFDHFEVALPTGLLHIDISATSCLKD